MRNKRDGEPRDERLTQSSNFRSRHQLHGVDPLAGKRPQGGRNRMLALEQKPLRLSRAGLTCRGGRG